MKKCFKCGREKAMEQYYRHPKMADGHLNKCKECTKADVESRREEKSKDPNWRVAELKRHREKAHRYRIEGKISKISNQTGIDWVKRNPEKKKATTMVNNALRDGKITKYPCEVCGNEKTHGHHDDYSKPLSVRWLCTKHHGEHHHNERVKMILESENPERKLTF